jgi:hypothetical protein
MVGQRRSQRGNALLLAVLIILAMISLGMLALRTTKQNISGAGNLRMNKQARYIAETALYEAITFMNLSSDTVLQLRPATASVVLDSSGGVNPVPVTYHPLVGAELEGPLWQGAGFMAASPGRPNPLGQYGEGSGLQGSFEVTIDGFRPGAPSPGSTAPGPEDTWGFCQMEFTARAYIADAALPDLAALNSAQGVTRFAEYTMRAGLVLRVNDASRCQN